MTKLLFRTILLSAVFVAGPCEAQTQSEMNDQAGQTFRAADGELNTIYEKILTVYADDPVFLANLREAQRCWIVFRDAQLKMKYPDREQGYYGSIQPVCEANYRTELTQERSKALQVWLDGAVEGDACSGSVRAKP